MRALVLAICTVWTALGTASTPVWQQTVTGYDALSVRPLLGGLHPDAPADLPQLLALRSHRLWSLRLDAGGDGLRTASRVLNTADSEADARLVPTTDGEALVVQEYLDLHARERHCLLIRLRGDGTERWRSTIDRSCPARPIAVAAGKVAIVSLGHLILLGRDPPDLPAAAGNPAYFLEDVLAAGGDGRRVLVRVASTNGEAGLSFFALLDVGTGRTLAWPQTREGYGAFLAHRTPAEGGFDLLFRFLSGGTGTSLLRLRLDEDGTILAEQPLAAPRGELREAVAWQDGFVVLSQSESAAGPFGSLLAFTDRGIAWQQDFPGRDRSAWQVRLVAGGHGEVAVGRRDRILRFDAEGQPQSSVPRFGQAYVYAADGALWVVHEPSDGPELAVYPPDASTPRLAAQLDIAPTPSRLLDIDARVDGSVHTFGTAPGLRRWRAQSFDAQGRTTQWFDLPTAYSRVYSVQHLEAGWVIAATNDRFDPAQLLTLDHAGVVRMLDVQGVSGARLACNHASLCVRQRDTTDGQRMLEQFDFSGRVLEQWPLAPTADAKLAPGPYPGSLRMFVRDPASGDHLLHTLDVWPPALLNRSPGVEDYALKALGDGLLLFAPETGSLTLYAGGAPAWLQRVEQPYLYWPLVNGQLRKLDVVPPRHIRWSTIDSASGLPRRFDDVEYDADFSLGVRFDSVGAGVDWLGLSQPQQLRVMGLRPGAVRREWKFSGEPESLIALPGDAAIVSWVDPAAAMPEHRIARLEMDR